MPYYYLSFCDPDRPKGQKFLGATVVEADNMDAALFKSCILGINPGGEVMIAELVEFTDQMIKYLNEFVPREEVMSGPYRPLMDSVRKH